ncbi:hypothetical protein HAX54_012545 [Datura stramonium]|uniref:Uncharacterized protein n=1 Tax=Datura stramonium TaxID=4076 RepID=A0ABS8RY96_DATST|nr:hypothetical protein [Datura stramonium]
MVRVDQDSALARGQALTSRPPTMKWSLEVLQKRCQVMPREEVQVIVGDNDSLEAVVVSLQSWLLGGNDSGDDSLVALMGHHEETWVGVQGSRSVVMDGCNSLLNLATTHGVDCGKGFKGWSGGYYERTDESLDGFPAEDPVESTDGHHESW